MGDGGAAPQTGGGAAAGVSIVPAGLEAPRAEPLNLRFELRDTLRLAWPLVLNSVGHMSMGMVDTLVAGHISTTALGGLGLAANFFWTFTSVCLGCLLALDTYFAQAVGAGEHKGLQRYLGQGFWACGFVAALSGAFVVGGTRVYLWMAPPSALRDAFGTYMHTIVWCLPGLFVYFVLLRYWQARRRVLTFTVIILTGNVLNLWACLGFGLGHWGFPRLGVRGLALATVTSRSAMLVAAIAFTWWQLRPGREKRLERRGPVQLLRAALAAVPRVDWSIQRQIFGLGLPAAGHTALEIGVFTIATFVVGTLGEVPLAAHHVSLMMASFTFMFPLGFSAAAAVRVGTFIGAGQPERARVAGWLCVIVSMVVMSGFALGYLTLPKVLLGAFTEDHAVIEVGVKILMLVALFQIADGTQVSTTGALRGLGNTRAAMIANLIGHYPIGLVLGLLLCFGFHLGVVGLWGGLAAGLISVALMLLRAWSGMTRDLARLKPLVAAE